MIEVCREFTGAQEQRLEDNRITRCSLDNILLAVNKDIVPFFGKMKIDAITEVQVEDFYSWLRKTRRLSAVTAKGRLQELRRICDFAERRNYLVVNVAARALKDLSSVARNEIRTFTKDEIAVLLCAAERRGKWQHKNTLVVTKCAVHLAAICGLRLGEILGLTRRHINFDAGIIEVRHSLTEYGELKGPKTRAGVRDVPMPRHVAAMLKEWLRAGYVENERSLVFLTPTGRFITSPSFNTSYWGPLLKRAGLDGGDRFHFHALRHFASSWWIANGYPLPDVASIMGHSKFDLTLQVYAHPVIGGNRRGEMFQTMSDRLFLSSEVTQGLRMIGEDEENQPLKNMVTILAEERLALVVRRPAALVYGTLVAGATPATAAV